MKEENKNNNKKRYIVAKKLNRSNARRTELTRFFANNDNEAITHYNYSYGRMSKNYHNLNFRTELLTGDWRHLAGEDLAQENNNKEDNNNG